MWYSFEPQQRGTKVIVDQNHVKTIPTKITFEKKRLTAHERKTLETYLQYQKWIDKLAISEKHLYQLIKDAYPVSTQHVISHNTERYELVLDNKMKVKCPEKIYLLFTTKPNVIHSNF